MKPIDKSMANKCKLISVQETLDDLKKETWWSLEEKIHIIRFLKNRRRVDAIPVVHGKWMYQNCRCTCSVCGKDPERYESDYCPNCGARMDLIRD